MTTISNNVSSIARGVAMALGLGSVTIPGQAQDRPPGTALEEVIVTAQKREEVAQEVPMAISTLSSKLLEKVRLVEVSDIPQLVPALTIVPFPSSSSVFAVFMRGVGVVDAELPAVDMGVGVYIDDMYIPRAQGLGSSLFDLERIEVLRGPQGTLYGRNTIGGAVKFVTAKPTGQWGFKESLDVGESGHFRSVTAVNFPEVASLSAKLIYLNESRDGLVKNPGSGGDWGEQDAESLRAALRWNPVEPLTVDYVFEMSSQDGTPNYPQRIYSETPSAPFTHPVCGGPCVVPITSERRSVSWRGTDLKLADNYEIEGHSLTAQWDVSDAVSLKSITGYRDISSNRLIDQQDAWGLPVLQYGELSMHAFSQELLFNGDWEHFNLTVGANYYEDAGDYLTSTSTPFLPYANGQFRPITMADSTIPFFHHFENESKGVYGQATWKPGFANDLISLTAGVRYTEDSRSVQRNRLTTPVTVIDATPPKLEYSSTDPAATLDFKLTDSIHTYVRYAQAYRAGGFYLRAPASDPPFDKEELISQEVGIKSMFFDDRLQLNLAGHISDWKNIQVVYTGSDLLAHMSNAGDAEIKGIELDFAVIPFEGLTLSGAYVHQTWETKGPFEVTLSPPPSGIVPKLPFLPEDKYSVAAELVFPAWDRRLSTRLDYSWTSEEWHNSGTLDEAPGYALLNGRVTFSRIAVGDGNLDLSVWGTNLLDEDYIVYEYIGSAIYGEKRVVGVNFTYSYE